MESSWISQRRKLPSQDDIYHLLPQLSQDTSSKTTLVFLSYIYPPLLHPCTVRSPSPPLPSQPAVALINLHNTMCMLHQLSPFPPGYFTTSFAKLPSTEKVVTFLFFLYSFSLSFLTFVLRLAWLSRSEKRFFKVRSGQTQSGPCPFDYNFSFNERLDNF